MAPLQPLFAPTTTPPESSLGRRIPLQTVRQDQTMQRTVHANNLTAPTEQFPTIQLVSPRSLPARTADMAIPNSSHVHPGGSRPRISRTRCALNDIRPEIKPRYGRHHSAEILSPDSRPVWRFRRSTVPRWCGCFAARCKVKPVCLTYYPS